MQVENGNYLVWRINNGVVLFVSYGLVCLVLQGIVCLQLCGSSLGKAIFLLLYSKMFFGSLGGFT